MLLLSLLGMAGVTAGVSSAQVPPTVTPSPTSGVPGSSLTITFSAFYRCKQVQLTFAGLSAVRYGETGSWTLTVPDIEPGTYPITAVGAPCQSTAGSRFTIRAAPPTTPPPTVPPTTTTPPTVPPTTVPPRTTTRRPTTTTTPPTTTTTAPTVPTEPTVPVTEPTVPTEPGKDGGEPGDLVFDKPAVQAGDPLAASGSGCTPRAAVTLSSGGHRVGTATADSDGEFTTPVEFTRIEPGRHTVTASCGVVLAGNVDLILTSSSSGSTGTLVVLVFFLLVTVTLVVRSRA